MSKRKLYLLCILLAIIFLYVRWPAELRQSTTSEIKIIKKEHTKNDSQAWIKVINPNSLGAKNEFKINITEPMVWNLIKENENYLATYKKKGNNPWELTQIAVIGEDEALK
ncbi:hypothetical protein JOC77_000851 [Peribacillus deserti]|uniref:Uncharacterized protein n=1 Tax=Peribacillus deserti TaxID=673318 RepID=A0ABS2QE52_9BACI|nr:hypothetical protein [Peribacillus deserti]MBM7691446.1 hypothetical protein [Peribacillus deserti]